MFVVAVYSCNSLYMNLIWNDIHGFNFELNLYPFEILLCCLIWREMDLKVFCSFLLGFEAGLTEVRVMATKIQEQRKWNFFPFCFLRML